MSVDFPGILSEARRRLHRPGVLSTLFARDKSKIDTYLAPHYKLLEKKGEVVWGAIAQANAMAFEPGETDLPCNVIYSVDPYFDDRPHEILKIAMAVYYLKGKHPRDVAFTKVAALISDEMNMVARFPLPQQLTSERTVYLGSTRLVRNRLPGGFLQGSLIPLVVAPQETEVNMLLPLRCWPSDLLNCWTSLEDVEPHASVLNLEYAEPPTIQSSTRVKPFAITPEARRELMAVMKKHKRTQAFVRIGVIPEGHSMDITDNYGRARDHLASHDGINVIWQKELTRSMCNTTLDFKQTTVGAGFVFLDT